MYYNSTNQTDTTLAEYIASAESLENKILKVFQTFPKKEFSAEQIHAVFFYTHKESSCRRAVTDLKNAGKLEITGNTILGSWGRPNKTLKLATQPTQPLAHIFGDPIAEINTFATGIKFQAKTQKEIPYDTQQTLNNINKIIENSAESLKAVRNEEEIEKQFAARQYPLFTPPKI